MSDTARRIEATLVSPSGMHWPITAAVDLHSIGESGPRFSVNDFRYCSDGTPAGLKPGWRIEFDVNFAEAMGWIADEAAS